MERGTLEKYILEKYGAEGESLWAKYPSYKAFRHRENKKWFALLMDVSEDKLGIEPPFNSEPRILNILNVKCDFVLAGSFLTERGFYPAYHMNKNCWISIDMAQVEEDKIKLLLDMSYKLTETKTADNAEKPKRNGRRAEKETLLSVLKREQAGKISGGIYHKIQIELTYNSNHIEGSRLTHEQTRYIFETNTVGVQGESINVDDILETTNHFRCIDMCIGQAKKTLSEGFIKEIHRTLKWGTSDSRKAWFNAGEYKRLPNEVGGRATTLPELVPKEMSALLAWYNGLKVVTFNDIIEFHVRFESIHPFQDGNGRVGRLIMFKECLKNGIVPFIIDEEHKLYYYRGLREWENERGYLIDTCLSAQDGFKRYLDYFRIPYKE